MVQHGYFGTVEQSGHDFCLLGSDQDCQHNNLKLICGMIQLKLLRTVKKKTCPFLKFGYKGELPMAVRETRPRFWSDMCPQTCTQSLYSYPPSFQRATSTLKSLNFDWEYQRPSKVSIHFIQCSLKLGWYSGTPPNQWMCTVPEIFRYRPLGPYGPLTKGPSAAKGCSWSFKFWIHCSASVKDP